LQLFDVDFDFCKSENERSRKAEKQKSRKAEKQNSGRAQLRLQNQKLSIKLRRLQLFDVDFEFCKSENERSRKAEKQKSRKTEKRKSTTAIAKSEIEHQTLKIAAL
jgi:hypothetical protein